MARRHRWGRRALPNALADRVARAGGAPLPQLWTSDRAARAIDIRKANCLPDWIICGGESGGHARVMHPAWARHVRDQCCALGIAFFHKQWGTYWSNPLVQEDGLLLAEAERCDPRTNGKGGALLDGRLHRDFPDEQCAVNRRASAGSVWPIPRADRAARTLRLRDGEGLVSAVVVTSASMREMTVFIGPISVSDTIGTLPQASVEIVKLFTLAVRRVMGRKAPR